MCVHVGGGSGVLQCFLRTFVHVGFGSDVVRCFLRVFVHLEGWVKCGATLSTHVCAPGEICPMRCNAV